MVRRESCVYKIVDGCEIALDVCRSDDDIVRPILIFIHGGALIMGSRAWIHPTHIERYTADGFAIVSIDYRLAPETRLAAIVEDLQAAFAWARTDGATRFALDPARVAVVGHSAGGYLALVSGYRVEPRPRAIVSYYGYGDVAGAWYSRPDPFYCQEPRVSEAEAREAVGQRPITDGSGPSAELRHRFYLYCRQRGLWPREVVGADPDAEPAAFDPFCPVRNVTADYPPTLLLHGDRDTDVPYEQSVLMAARLAEAGVEHELITIRGGGHGFENDRDRPDVAAAVDLAHAFLKRWAVDR
jgi:acetyl esterase/lipase